MCIADWRTGGGGRVCAWPWNACQCKRRDKSVDARHLDALDAVAWGACVGIDIGLLFGGCRMDIGVFVYGSDWNDERTHTAGVWHYVR